MMDQFRACVYRDGVGFMAIRRPGWFVQRMLMISVVLIIHLIGLLILDRGHSAITVMFSSWA